MARTKGKEGVLQISSTTVAQLRSYTLDHSAMLVDATVMGSNAMQRDDTLQDFNLQSEVFWDLADAGQDAVSVGASVTVTLYPQGVGSSANYYQGAAKVERITVAGRPDGLVEGTIALQGNGVLASLTV